MCPIRALTKGFLLNICSSCTRHKLSLRLFFARLFLARLFLARLILVHCLRFFPCAAYPCAVYPCAVCLYHWRLFICDITLIYIHTVWIIQTVRFIWISDVPSTSVESMGVSTTGIFATSVSVNQTLIQIGAFVRIFRINISLFTGNSPLVYFDLLIT